MKTFEDVSEMQAFCAAQKEQGKSIGVVMTMGALHAGHMSLAKIACQDCDIVVATIFVNPTQFAPTEDLEQYPRPLEKDLELLAAEGVDAVFLPTNATMYPAGYSTLVQPPGYIVAFEFE